MSTRSSDGNGERSPKRPRRKPVACQRCHSRKVKCSGGQPCSGCRQAHCASDCVYQVRDRQVKVAQSYIDDLVEENERLRKGEIGSQAAELTDHAIPQASEPNTGNNEEAARNPLLEERPWFFPIAALNMPIHIGEAADAAFATRFRQALSRRPHNHIPRVDYATDVDLLALSESEKPWPSPARARFLVKTALHGPFQCYHIVRKSTVLQDLELAIQSPGSNDSLMVCRLWALFALGELYSARVSSRGQRFPGLSFFAQASRLQRVLSERPRIEYMEVLLLLSLYSFYLNRRHSAYYLVGSAIRVGVIIGLHLNIPEFQSIERETREHQKRVWWTAYIFDRMWATKMGHPVSIHDDDIEVDSPSMVTSSGDDFGDCAYMDASVQLAKLAGRMTASIYGRRMQQGHFSQRVQHSLKELTNWVECLPEHLQIRMDSPSIIVSDAIVSLHLSFNQCVILATRPVLLHVLRTHTERLENETGEKVTANQLSGTASALAEACIRCARHSHRLLVRAWIRGSFFIFDYFYTQYLFSAISILAISRLLKGKDGNTDGEDYETGTQLLEDLRQNGNFAAIEFCRHTEAMRLSMDQYLRKTEDTTIGTHPPETGVPATSAVTVGIANAPLLTAGMALTEPSLQEFLAQPDSDVHFMNMYEDMSQGTFFPGLDSEHWMTG